MKISVNKRQFSGQMAAYLGVVTLLVFFALPGIAQAQTTTFASAANAMFPAGGQVSDTIQVSGCGTVNAINMDIDISYSWRNDLTIYLQSPDGTQYALWSRFGGSANDIIGNFNQTLAPSSGFAGQPVNPISDFEGQNADGNWIVTVDEEFNWTPGTLNYWALNIDCGAGGGSSGGGGGSSTGGGTTTFSATPNATFPAGGQVSHDILVSGCGTVNDINMDIDVSYSWRNDLTIYLQSPNGTQYALWSRYGGSANDIIGNFNQTLAPSSGWNGQPVVPMTHFIGKEADGHWTVTVDEEFFWTPGTLNSWGLNIDCDGGNEPSVVEVSECPFETIPAFAGTATHSINVSGCGTVTGIDMDIYAQHWWRGDLSVHLQSPDGQLRTLKANPGTGYWGSSADDIIGNFNQTLDPECGFPCQTRHFQTVVPISDFEGVAGEGLWTVMVEDHWSGGPSGTLQCWGLNLVCDGGGSGGGGGADPVDPGNQCPDDSLPPPGGTGWNFDPMCSAQLCSEVEETPPANAFLMLDKSGSMGWTHGVWGSGGQSNWQIAVNSINAASQALQSELNLGLGYFWSGSANTPVQCLPNNANSIASSLSSNWPGGGTPTATAVNTMIGSSCMNDPNTSAGGVLITDGVPTQALSSVISATCNAREQGYLLYIVGLGGGTNQNFNNYQAAAAGTGACYDSSGNEIDPCQQSLSSSQWSNCEGAYFGTSQTEFQNVLMEIGGEISCTFDIDTSLHVTGEAPNQPGAVDVKYYGASGWQSIPYRDNTSDNQGWYFPSSGVNDQIALTDSYCALAQQGGIDFVSTQLACDCTLAEGDPCTLSNPGPLECGEGTFICDNGFAVCEPAPLWECPTGCEDTVGGDSCHVGNSEGLDLMDIANGEQYAPGMIFEPGTGAVTRCDVGTVVCEAMDGYDVPQPVCRPDFRPMPETCNGLDDSCDGKVDNIDESWADWYAADTWDEWVLGRNWDDGNSDQWSSIPAGYDFMEGTQGAMCGFEDICACRDGPAEEHLGSGATALDEFDEYLLGFDSPCRCVAPMH